MREKILTKKKGGGGVKASLNDFFAQDGRYKKTGCSLNIWGYSQSLAAHLFLPSLDFW